MINLLPQKDKEKLLIGKNKRMSIILCFLILFFLIYLIIALFIVKIYLNGQLASNKVFLEESEKQFSQSETQELQDKIESANKSFSGLNSFYDKKVYFSKLLEKIAVIFPENFYLTNFSIMLDVKEKKEENVVVETTRTIRASLSGFAPTREELLTFKENLEKDGSFENISFPISNWASKENINFYVTFDISI